MVFPLHETALDTNNDVLSVPVDLGIVLAVLLRHYRFSSIYGHFIQSFRELWTSLVGR